MPFRYLHVADLQVGKPFAGVRDPGKQARLRAERVEVIGRLVSLVEERKLEAVLIAGDLFDTVSPTRADVSLACARLGALRVPVLVIPGNHDHAGPGTVWRQEYFRDEQRALAPNLRVLLEAAPLVLADRAVILPCPLLARATGGDPTAWIRGLDFGALPTGLPRIVLAHGSVQGFDGGAWDDLEDGDAGSGNRIDLARLPQGELDAIALGDWHGAKQVGLKAWYSGTPEPDRHPKGDGNRPGHALVVEAARGAPPVVEAVPTGRVRWQAAEVRLGDGADALAPLTETVERLLGARAGEDVLALTLTGLVGLADRRRLDALLATLEARLIRLDVDDRVVLEPTADELEALTRRSADPLIAAAAGRLAALAGDAADPVQAARARLALRELHALLQA